MLISLEGSPVYSNTFFSLLWLHSVTFPHRGINKPFYRWSAQHTASNWEAVRLGHFLCWVVPYSKWGLTGAKEEEARGKRQRLLRLLSFNFLVCSLLQGEIGIVLWRAASGWDSILQAFLVRGGGWVECPRWKTLQKCLVWTPRTLDLDARNCSSLWEDDGSGWK